MKYKIEVDDEQLNIMRIAIEEYFRIRMGQYWDLADTIAFTGFDYDNYTKEEFDRRITSRDTLRDLLDGYSRTYRINEKPDDISMAVDMWHVIEHQQWLDMDPKPKLHRASGKPFPMCSGVELMKIERCEE